MSEQFWDRYVLLELSYSVVLNYKTVLPNDLRVLRNLISVLRHEPNQSRNNFLKVPASN